MDIQEQDGNKPARKSRLGANNFLSELGKLPPQAIELEAAVLGALMLEKDALTAVIDILKPESFYKDAHREIFLAIKALFAESEPIDMLTVNYKLRQTGKLELAGGPHYLADLTFRVNSAANIETHARLISEHAIRRALLQVASEIQREGYDDTLDVFQFMDRVQQLIFDVSESYIRKNYVNMTDLARQFIDDLEAKKGHQDGLTGVPSGFSSLDRVTSGWQKSDLVILAARPGMGKTAMVVSAARNAAVDWKFGVAIFSLEMSSLQLMGRLVSAEAELESEKLKKAQLAPYEWEQLHHALRRLEKAPIFIDDTPALSVLELRAKCRKLKAQHDIQLVIVDYLQLMTADSGGKNKVGNREQEIATISKSLKSIAKELNVPVIALSQLSRAVETRGGEKRPQLSDLRESGSIEQDADMVIFLYRPEYYGLTADESGNSTVGLGEVIIAKHRNGSLDTVNLRFVGKYTKFSDFDNTDLVPLNSAGKIPDGLSSFESEGNGTIIKTLGSRINSQPPQQPSQEEPPF
ncbi:MAG: replicative DNA helicase [Verrucomicrobia bacterium]|nr:replicative DNA helicase [Cytophagales bacterium]